MSRTCTQIELSFRIGERDIDTPLTSNREGFEKLFGAPTLGRLIRRMPAAASRDRTSATRAPAATWYPNHPPPLRESGGGHARRSAALLDRVRTPPLSRRIDRLSRAATPRRASGGPQSSCSSLRVLDPEGSLRAL